MVALLDVNFLVAMFHAGHIHHEAAHAWFEEHAKLGWATCPITEMGMLRVLSNPTLQLSDARLSQVSQRMIAFCNHPKYHFWPDSISLAAENTWALQLARGYKQVTDIYLLALAVRNRGRLVTFDQNIPLRAVRGTSAKNLVLVKPPNIGHNC